RPADCRNPLASVISFSFSQCVSQLECLARLSRIERPPLYGLSLSSFSLPPPFIGRSAVCAPAAFHRRFATPPQASSAPRLTPGSAAAERTLMPVPHHWLMR